MRNKSMAKKEVMSWKDRLAQDAAKTLNEETADSVRIGPKHGKFWKGEAEIGSTLEVIIVAGITEKALYTAAYDPDKIANPDCFAQNEHSDMLVPHENVPSPCSEDCAGCPNAVFGTARVGKGPACKTYKKIAMISVSDEDVAGFDGSLEEYIAQAELCHMKVSPTSVKNYKKYAATLAGEGMPPWAVRSTVTIKPDPKTQWQINFREDGFIKVDEVLAAINARMDEALDLLQQPYTYDEDDAPVEESGKY
jgi:hypothetical protein